MAVSLNFRTALSGFHREDVVHYIEYMNARHSTQVNQLEEQLAQLHAQLAASEEKPDLTAQVAALQAQLEEADARFIQLQQEKEQLVIERDDALARAEQIQMQLTDEATRNLAAMELEAYRRAEQAERSAKLRAEQIYHQATGTLAQATTQVDSAANRFRQVAEQVSFQMTQLQLAVESSKNALLDAATTMYSIRPEEIEE